MNPSRKMRRAAEKRDWARQRAEEKQTPRADASATSVDGQAAGNWARGEVDDDGLMGELGRELAQFRELNLARQEYLDDLASTPDGQQISAATDASLIHECPTCGADLGVFCDGEAESLNTQSHPARLRAAGY